MKKRQRYILTLLFISLFLLLGKSATYAQSSQQLFDTANNLYEKHQYDSALVLYRQLLDKGFNNAELYYNAGNASLKRSHLGFAVYYYEKALQESPGNAVIKHNLAIARQQVTDKIDQVPTLFFIRWWHELLHWHTANAWMAGSILLFWLLVFFIGWRLLRRHAARPAPRWTKWAIVLFSILFCLYLSGAIGTWYRQTHHVFAVVVKAEEPLKAAPDGGSADVLVVHEGLKVKLLDSVNNWRKIKLTDGKEGWVQADSLLDL